MNPEYYSRTTYIRGNKKSRDHVQKNNRNSTNLGPRNYVVWLYDQISIKY